MSAHNSIFEGLWTDHPNALLETEQRLSNGTFDIEEAKALKQFINHGFVIIKNADSANLAGKLFNEITNIHNKAKYSIARTKRQSYSYADKTTISDRSFRLIDLHANSILAQQAQFSPKIKRFLELIFEQPPLAFQSLTFIHGSQQGVHQDGAYVVVSDPLKFAASWIALEDVKKGSGELLYYPGSHRLPDYMFSQKYKSWNPERDGENEGARYIQSLKEKIQSSNLSEARFLPQKGDALIWAADLAHGGSKITNNSTRASFITHYCPMNIAPNYKSFSGTFEITEAQNGGHIGSRHYDLRKKKKFFLRKSTSLKKPSFMGRTINVS